MPINPITLDKIEPIVIRNIENRAIDKIVHEVKESNISHDNSDGNSNFDGQKQQKAAEKFGYFLSKFNIKFEYKILKNRIRVKIKDIENRVLIETDIEDIEKLIENIKKETGSIIDMKG